MTKKPLMLMDAGRIERSLKRIAYQIAEANKAGLPVVLLGINERGFLLAKKLDTYVSSIYSSQVESLQLLLPEGEVGMIVGANHIKLKKAFLVLVDDVIFSGATMFRALTYLSDLIELREIHTAVLIDRGHRKLPIDAQFVGLDLPTKFGEHVSLTLQGNEIQGVKLNTI
jgi:pyrimidine operon attenuation protein/uracil phosphoribosyltransferase